MDAKKFVNKIEKENEALFVACELQVKNYFDSNPSKEEMIDHFVNRMINERMNMIEISGQVNRASDDADPEQLYLIAKQAFDEAKHFKMVKDVVEHIAGEPLDVAAAVASQKGNESSKGASLLDKYEAADDPLMLALYQFVAEGRAARNWAMMGECVADPFVAKSYKTIAKDEKFHSNIGKKQLLELCKDEAQQERVLAVINNMRKDLYTINCLKVGTLPESQKIMDVAYGEAA
jgi:1,2-phenylacetyl-CoA epoxidase catalytic subunit